MTEQREAHPFLRYIITFKVRSIVVKYSIALTGEL